MKNSKITPALNSELVKVAQAACIAKNAFTKKDFDREMNTAIKAAGYSVAYYNRVMSSLFNPNY